MTEHELSRMEASHGEQEVLPHDPPPPSGWFDPLEGTAVAEVLDEAPDAPDAPAGS